MGMIMKIRIILTTLILAIPAHSGSALSQAVCTGSLGQDCACALPLTDFDPGSTAQLSGITGNVNISTSSQFSSTDTAVVLDMGDSAVILENSGALLSFGPTCSRQLASQSSLVIRSVGGCACASLVEAEVAAETELGAAAVLAGVAAAAAVGTTAYLISQNDDEDDSVSPD